MTKLSAVSEILEHWGHVQSMWINVEAVFSLSDTSTQLSSEARRFFKVDAAYMKLMGRASEHRNVIETCCADNQLRNLLPHLAGQLEICQKSLSGYLDQKRAIFPRFFFLSDWGLLEMLSEGLGSSAVECHMNAMFEGIRSFTFEADTASALRVGSGTSSSGKAPAPQQDQVVIAVHARRGSCGETLALTDYVQCAQPIEALLASLLFASHSAVEELFIEEHNKNADAAANSVLAEMIKTYPMQVCMLSLQVQWTRECVDALVRARQEKSIMLHCNKRQAVLLSELIDLIRGELLDKQRLVAETLVTIQMYQREAFDELVQRRVASPADFDWLRRVRYSYNSNAEELVVSIADMHVHYSWEYVGLQERLVCSPATERCFIALSQAVGLAHGCAVAGGCGTGKTETIHDLGRAFGRFTVTMTCTVQSDARALDRMFKGWAASGSWGCLDGLNNVHPKVHVARPPPTRVKAVQ